MSVRLSRIGSWLSFLEAIEIGMTSMDFLTPIFWAGLLA